MTKNFYHFLSEIPCSISINGYNLGIIDNQTIFEKDIIAKCDNFFVTFTPFLNKTNYLPYTYSISTQNISNLENSYIKIIPFPNNHYDILMKPFYYYQIENSKVLLNQNLDKYFVSILNDNISRITIFSGATIVFSMNTYLLKKAKANLKNNLIIIEGVIDYDNYYLLVINSKNFEIIFNDKIQSIEKTEDYLQTYKSLNTIAKHAEICKIDFKTLDHQKYYVYEKEFIELPKNNLLIPYTFLEAVKYGDENIIRDNISINLQNTPLLKFQEYFGNIQDIYLNRHSDFTNKINYTIFNGSYKNFDFVIDANKITDIEEIF